MAEYALDCQIDRLQYVFGLQGRMLSFVIFALTSLHLHVSLVSKTMTEAVSNDTARLPWNIGTFEDLFHFTTMHLATLLLDSPHLTVKSSSICT